MRKTGLCRLCLQQKPLIKAHLLPRSFVKKVKGNDRTLVLVKNLDLGTNQKLQDSLYDMNILCATCDNTFSQCERYARTFFDGGFSDLNILGPTIKFNPKGNYLHYFNVDTGKLKLFILATLWRLSISRLPECENVNLGPLEAIVRHHLINLDPGENTFMPFCIYSLTRVNDVRARLISSPIIVKVSGTKVFMMHIHDFFLMVRLTKNGDEKNDSSIISKDELFICEFKNDRGIQTLNDFYGRKLPWSRRW